MHQKLYYTHLFVSYQFVCVFFSLLNYLNHQKSWLETNALILKKRYQII